MSFREAFEDDTGPIVCVLREVLRGIDRQDGRVLWETQVSRGGLRLAMSRDLVYTAGYSWLYCVDRFTGEQLWKAQLKHSGEVGILLLADRVVVASIGQLECFSLTGKQLWLQPFKGGGYSGMAMGVPGQLVHQDQDNNRI